MALLRAALCILYARVLCIRCIAMANACSSIAEAAANRSCFSCASIPTGSMSHSRLRKLCCRLQMQVYSQQGVVICSCARRFGSVDIDAAAIDSKQHDKRIIVKILVKCLCRCRFVLTYDPLDSCIKFSRWDVLPASDCHCSSKDFVCFCRLTSLQG